MTKRNNKELEMINYEQGKIYKIEPVCDHDENEIYIGSTTKKLLSQRINKHRSNYKRWKEGKEAFTRSYSLFEKYGVENCQIVLIENVENCKSKNELNAREAYYIKTLQCVNKVIPLRTKSEYREDNREHILQQHRKYDEEHKEQHRNNVKKYYQENKEIKNRKCNCECGSIYTQRNKSVHQRTIKHQLFLQNNPVV